jgi:hypothetical protein
LETRQKMKFSPFFPLQANKKTLEVVMYMLREYQV